MISLCPVFHCKTDYNIANIDNFHYNGININPLSDKYCFSTNIEEQEMKNRFIINCIKIAGKCASAILFNPATPIAPIVMDEVFSEIIDNYFEKSKRSTQLTPSHVLKLCKKMIPNASNEYIEILASTVYICLEHLDIFAQAFDSKILAEKLSKEFLIQHEKHFGADELLFLKKNLPPVLEETIHKLEIEAEADPSFQVDWKTHITTRVHILENTQEKLSRQVEDHEIRISKQEEQHRKALCQVAELSDLYSSKWNDSLFLDEDIVLSDIYQLPHYNNDLTDLHEILQETIDLCNDVNRRTLVILGHPGSGKSSLLTYILQKCSISADRAVRVFRFSGFEGVNWNGNIENLPQLMLNCLGLGKNDLNNSVLILDGLDEIDMRGRHEDLLEELYKQWVKAKNIKRFSLFITCRTNRIKTPDSLSARNITLCPLDDVQIKTFAQSYSSGKGQCQEEKIITLSQLYNCSDSFRNIIGIPLILYLTLALNISLDHQSGLDDIYGQIFSLSNENSIYSRRVYDVRHPITSEEASKIHLFSKKIAEKIWEIDPNEATVKKSVYEPIAAEIAGSGEQELRKILIGQYFMEGKDGCELLFVHRSMYEYFVALSIFDSLKAIVATERDPKSLFVEQNDILTEFSCVICLQDLAIYPDIQDYLRSLLIKFPIADIKWWRAFFTNFLEYGLSDFATGRRKGGLKGIKEELNRFYNLVWLTREQLIIFDEPMPVSIVDGLSEVPLFQITYEDKRDLQQLELREIKLLGKDLSEATFVEADLENADFTKSNLSYADFRGACMVRAMLEHVCLSGAILDNACLRGACLCGADLSNSSLHGVDLSNADLSNADLRDADLRFANLTGANLSNAVLTGALISCASFKRTNFSCSTLDDLDFSGIDCSEAIFKDASMKCIIGKKSSFVKANMQGTKLMNSELSSADLSGANFDDAHLNEAFFVGSKLVNARLVSADLSSATFTGSDLKDADLRKALADNTYFKMANLYGADLRGTSLTNADFSGANLNEVKTYANALSSIICNPEDRKRWEINECQSDDAFFFNDPIRSELIFPEIEYPISSFNWDIPRDIQRRYEEYYEDLEDRW